MIEADVNGAKSVCAQPRKDARLQQRGFSESGLTEEDHERAQPGQLRQFVDLVIPPVKEAGLFLGERGEARPGIVRVGGRGGTRAGCAGTLNAER